ncbi:hypothetical protein F2Q70_00043864 [Brassica cretica]|uniref:Uncharacterized protein n=1 Tax=Brassica cretica TaxID=69181 RepID=A0A8S9KKV8_BRACR|nr:hypothetical protein F2Q70_00043864 [Brassica cretica]
MYLLHRWSFATREGGVCYSTGRAFIDVVRISACFGGHVRVGLLICCFHPVFGFDGECSCLSPSLVFGSGVYDTRAALPFPDNHSAAACLCGISS